jgi:hypothetical protein
MGLSWAPGHLGGVRQTLIPTARRPETALANAGSAVQSWQDAQVAGFSGGEPVAQLVEHETFNLGVVGSSPTGLTVSGAKARAVQLRWVARGSG